MCHGMEQLLFAIRPKQAGSGYVVWDSTIYTNVYVHVHYTSQAPVHTLRHLLAHSFNLNPASLETIFVLLASALRVQTQLAD